MYDNEKSAEEKYLPQKNFHGYSRQKISFVLSSLSKSYKSNVVILSHINLLPVGFCIKLISPKTKLLLFAHGIEVWGPLSAIKKIMLHKCDRILAVSSFTKAKLEKELSISPEKILVLNNCLDPFLLPSANKKKNKSLLAQLKLDDEAVILLTVTRLSSQEMYKGYDKVLHAVKELLPRYPNLTYILAGKADEAEKKRVNSIIRSLGISRQVRCTGFIPEDELINYFNTADIFIMPSGGEGFGIIFIEAMFYGLPVIAGNKDGSADALLQGRLGMLIDPGNQSAINNALEKMLVNRLLFSPDKELLMQHFSFEVYKHNLKKIFSSLQLTA